MPISTNNDEDKVMFVPRSVLHRKYTRRRKHGNGVFNEKQTIDSSTYDEDKALSSHVPSKFKGTYLLPGRILTK